LKGGITVTHAHVTTWFLTIILFAVAYFLQKKGKEKGLKIVQMILRLFYLLTLGTGIYLVHSYGYAPVVLFKGLIGLWVISTMEMVLVRKNKGKPVFAFGVQFFVSLVLVLFYGYVVIG
jgi:uncharacterized membrane protein SirB2